MIEEFCDYVIFEMLSWTMHLTTSILQEFKQKYPDVIVLDPPDAIQHVRNRQSMLQEVAQLKLRGCGGLIFLFILNYPTYIAHVSKTNLMVTQYSPGQVDVPRQLVVTGDPSTIPSIVAKAGLKLPLGTHNEF